MAYVSTACYGLDFTDYYGVNAKVVRGQITHDEGAVWKGSILEFIESGATLTQRDDVVTLTLFENVNAAEPFAVLVIDLIDGTIMLNGQPFTDFKIGEEACFNEDCFTLEALSEPAAA